MLKKITYSAKKYYQRILISNFTKSFILPKSTVNDANWHENFIAHLASLIKPNLYVEVGLDKCHTFNKIIPYAKNLIGVDSDSKVAKYITKSPKAMFLNIASDQFVKYAKEKKLKIDLLFIDANHQEKQVIKDSKGLFPSVSEDGLILLHDSFPTSKNSPGSRGSGTVHKAVDKLSKTSKEYEMVTIPIPPGLTIVRKCKKPGSLSLI